MSAPRAKQATLGFGSAPKRRETDRNQRVAAEQRRLAEQRKLGESAYKASLKHWSDSSAVEKAARVEERRRLDDERRAAPALNFLRTVSTRSNPLPDSNVSIEAAIRALVRPPPWTGVNAFKKGVFAELRALGAESVASSGSSDQASLFRFHSLEAAEEAMRRDLWGLEGFEPTTRVWMGQILGSLREWRAAAAEKAAQEVAQEAEAEAAATEAKRAAEEAAARAARQAAKQAAMGIAPATVGPGVAGIVAALGLDYVESDEDPEDSESSPEAAQNRARALCERHYGPWEQELGPRLAELAAGLHHLRRAPEGAPGGHELDSLEAFRAHARECRLREAMAHLQDAGWGAAAVAAADGILSELGGMMLTPLERVARALGNGLLGDAPDAARAALLLGPRVSKRKRELLVAGGSS
jgi:hypothetical protein